MLVTALVFTAGELRIAFASTLSPQWLLHALAGIGHGLFSAVAASTAAASGTRCDKEGRASRLSSVGLLWQWLLVYH